MTKNIKNFLFSTTRQWNPGDEIILLGLINLLKHKSYNFNPIIFNRNPDIRPNFMILNPFLKYRFNNTFLINMINSFVKISFFDNSAGPNFNYKIIDRAYIAGSPEWYSLRMYELYNKIQKNNIPYEIHGIGLSHNMSINKLPSFVKNFLKNSDLITVRDRNTFNLLSEHYKVKYITCPSLFCSAPYENNNKITHLGLTYVDSRSPIGNSIDESMYKNLINLYNKLILNLNFKISFICHYVSEIDRCRDLFPSNHIYYHYDARSYLDIYKNFDFVIGPRLHGIASSVSQGIPSILISHDCRSDAGKLFGIDVFNLNSNTYSKIMKILRNYNSIKNLRANIIKNYKSSKSNYLKLL